MSATRCYTKPFRIRPRLFGSKGAAPGAVRRSFSLSPADKAGPFCRRWNLWGGSSALWDAACDVAAIPARGSYLAGETSGSWAHIGSTSSLAAHGRTDIASPSTANCATRMPQSGDILQPEGSPGRHRAMAQSIQHRPTSLIARISTASAADIHRLIANSRSANGHAIISIRLVQNILQVILGQEYRCYV